MRPQIELTLRFGYYGERAETVIVPVSEQLSRELTEPVELSDDPFSLILASPGLFGGYGDATTIRREKFSLRRDVAKKLSRQIEDKLIEMFGCNDKIDGYNRKELE